MAKTNQNAKRAKSNSRSTKIGRAWEFPLEKENFMIMGAGLVVILIGYILMYTGVTENAATLDGKWNNPLAIGVAPVLLVIGYCIIIPFGLLKSFKKSENISSENQ